MRKYIGKLLVTGALLMTASIGANAAIISADFETGNDGNAFIDTRAGYEWIKLTQTAGMAISTASQRTEEGQRFEGFRVASEVEMGELFASIDELLTYERSGGILSGRSNLQADYDAMLSVITTIGILQSGSTAKHAPGLYQGTNGVIYRSLMSVGTASNRSNSLSTQYTGNYFEYQGLNGFGIFLVSDGYNTLSSQLAPTLLNNNPLYAVTEVSAPASFALLGVGLLGLLARRRD